MFARGFDAALDIIIAFLEGENDLHASIVILNKVGEESINKKDSLSRYENSRYAQTNRRT